jgi:hypothetical protein
MPPLWTLNCPPLHCPCPPHLRPLFPPSDLRLLFISPVSPPLLSCLPFTPSFPAPYPPTYPSYSSSSPLHPSPPPLLSPSLLPLLPLCRLPLPPALFFHSPRFFSFPSANFSSPPLPLHCPSHAPSSVATPTPSFAPRLPVFSVPGPLLCQPLTAFLSPTYLL